jgi:hypothetical protein
MEKTRKEFLTDLTVMAGLAAALPFAARVQDSAPARPRVHDVGFSWLERRWEGVLLCAG